MLRKGWVLPKGLVGGSDRPGPLQGLGYVISLVKAWAREPGPLSWEGEKQEAGCVCTKIATTLGSVLGCGPEPGVGGLACTYGGGRQVDTGRGSCCSVVLDGTGSNSSLVFSPAPNGRS